ncbi:MAG: response regulator transcription factor [Firmicutes bacterium]|jgi:DNA-binding LytR/AlgR family response regulator|nr:response regulator transcription factor [Bacillota bacterium]
MSNLQPAKLKVLIADDEAPARSELRYLLEKTGKVTVVDEASTGREAIQLTLARQPEAIFLDIKMPEQDGFAVAETVLAQIEPPPLMVFATAYDSYALRAFDVNAVDYILKPFQEERVAQTVNRLLTLRRDLKQAELAINLQSFLERIKEEQEIARVPVETNGRILLLPVTDICFAYCRDKEVIINTRSDEYQVRSTLAELEERLGHRFVRVHKGYLVNIDHVAEVIPWFHGSYLVVIADEKHTEIPVSRRQAPTLREKLGLVL